MDTADTVDKVTVKRGRPKKDPTSPLGDFQVEEAKKARNRKKQNKVTEKWYEIRGPKLSLCKKLSTGSVFRTLVGSVNDPKSGKEVKAFAEKLEKEGRLTKRI